jgi:hypothetical protein
MNEVGGSNADGRRSGWWAALLALVGVASDVPRLGVSTVGAQPEIHRSAVQAPSSWRDFAQRLQGKLAQRLAADTEAVSKLAKQMAAIADAKEAEPRAIFARVWVSRDGKIERLEFDGLDGDTAKEVRALVGEDDVGPPPPDMPQPIQLRLSLRTNPEQQQAQ